MKSTLPPLTEYGFLPVPPTVHEVLLKDMPGCFGAKPDRRQLWDHCVQFLELLKRSTPVRQVFVDGRFLTASDDVHLVEIGIELTPELLREAGGFDPFRLPSVEEYDVRVRYFAPNRPDKYNFHEEFHTPDPEIRLFGAPTDLRKGYVLIKL